MMMHRRYRRIVRDERGHAIVLGSVGMLIMALVVMSSVSLGDAVYQKIKLQDAADAQSYSIAVKQARAYNFFAYTNRTMVVHYNAMLTMLSYASHAFYLNETIGKAAKYLKWIPYIGQVLMVIERILQAYMYFADYAAVILTWLLQGLNWGLWLAQEAMLYATAMELWGGSGAGPIANTDKFAKTTLMDFLGGFVNAMNAFNFLHPVEDAMHDENPFSGTDGTPFGTLHRAKLLGSNRLDNPDFAKYRLLMDDIVNGHRLDRTANGRGPIIIGRRWSFSIPLVIKFKKVAETQLKSFRPNFEGDRKDQLFSMEDLKIEMWKGPLKGWKTVFTGHIRITADYKGGYHLVWGRKSNTHHKFMGISPFISSDTSFYNPWKYHFGQPCNVVALNKDMEGAKRAFQVKSKFTAGGFSGEVDMTHKDVLPDYMNYMGRTGGMVAVAVGRAIYHRPGNWKEEPNFFNPLWIARLAPVRSHWQEWLPQIIPGVMQANAIETINY